MQPCSWKHWNKLPPSVFPERYKSNAAKLKHSSILYVHSSIRSGYWAIEFIIKKRMRLVKIKKSHFLKNASKLYKNVGMIISSWSWSVENNRILHKNVFLLVSTGT